MMMETPKAYAEIHFTLERLLEALQISEPNENEFHYEHHSCCHDDFELLLSKVSLH